MDETDLLEPIAGSSTPQLPVDLLSIPLDELSDVVINTSLAALGDEEALDVCVRLLTTRSIEDEDVCRRIVDVGLQRCKERTEGLQAEIRRIIGDDVELDTTSPKVVENALEQISSGDEGTRTTLRHYSQLKDLQQRLETYSLFGPSAEAGPSKPRTLPETSAGPEENRQDDGQMDLDDPWAEKDDDGESADLDDPWESSSIKSAKSAHSIRSVKDVDMDDGETPPISLSAFLRDPLADSASAIAASGGNKALGTLYERHKRELWPYRYAILDSIPAWISPADIKSIGLLPQIGANDAELSPDQPPSSLYDLLPSTNHLASSLTPTSTPRTAASIKDWYINRIDALDQLGLLDEQLALVQHGASLGVPDLDAIGEELSLLSRLVYDAHLSPKQQAEWNLTSWRKASPESVIRAYISNATAEGIVADIRRLVLPYLYVLESRAERAGESATDLVERHIHDVLLGLPLNLALPIFEASKATTPQPERIIKNDLTVARLALACLYGSNERSQWSTMSGIFECLPVWDVSGGDPESDKEATATTLDSIAAFVRPTRAGAHPPTAKDLFIFFNPLPFASLSRALDILDVHLESGEILARWDTAVQLRFLLQSARNKEDQLELAEKMVRRQVSGQHTETRWNNLWGDMKRLAGGDDAMLRGAFGMLSTEEMVKVYLGGVLASGHFDIARKMIKRLETDGGISDGMLEQAVLQASREFYENAESGNIHTGEMKLAFDSLSVAPLTPAIATERDFIEATSRLSTFSLKSPSGRGTLSPLEIRHSKNRLSLVQQVLETSDDAYRHPELILELTDKLGYRNDLSAKVRVLALLSGSATRNGDYDTAWTNSQEMFNLSSKKHIEMEVVYKALVDLGSQSEFANVPHRMTLLGQALELCPPSEVPSILEVWRKVEAGQIRLSEAAKRRRIAGIKSTQPSASKRPTSPSSVASQEERVLGSRTAARAARLAMGFAGNHLNLKGIAPSPVFGSHSPATSAAGASPKVGQGASNEDGRKSSESDRPNFGSMFEGAGVKAGTAEAERVRQQARKALVRGVGWLLGADEHEAQHGS